VSAAPDTPNAAEALDPQLSAAETVEEADDSAPAGTQPARHDEHKRVHMGRSTLLMLVSRGVGLATSFATSIMTARALGPAGKGELALLLQVPVIVVALLSMGMGVANTYFVGRRMRTIGESLSDSLLITTIVSLVGMPATVIALMLIKGLEPVGNRTFAFASVMLPLSLVTLALAGILTGIGRVEALAERQTAGSVVGFALIAVAFAVGRLSVRSAVWISVTASLLSTLLLLGPLLPQLRRQLVGPSVSRIMETIRYSIKAHISGIAGFLNRRQDFVLLGILSTAADVGIYSVGTAISELLWNIPGSIANPIVARSIQESEEKGARLAAQAARVVLLLMLGAALLLAVLVKPLISLVYTPLFAKAAIVYLLLAPGSVLYGVGSSLLNYLVAHGRLYPRMALGVTLTNVVLNLALIPKFGIYGAAVSSTVSYSMGGLYLTWQFLRHSGLGWSSVFLPRTSDVRVVIASALSARPTRPQRAK
jgi:O-antigen/teichoic acid export membrane protein